MRQFHEDIIVSINGARLSRGQTIHDANGKPWIYEHLCKDNRSVVVRPADGPSAPIHRTSLGAFDISIRKVRDKVWRFLA